MYQNWSKAGSTRSQHGTIVEVLNHDSDDATAGSKDWAARVAALGKWSIEHNNFLFESTALAKLDLELRNVVRVHYSALRRRSAGRKSGADKAITAHK
jgi:hypothetical protein